MILASDFVSAYAIPLGALGVALAAMGHAFVHTRKQEEFDLTGQLHDRIEDLGRELESAERKIARFEALVEELKGRIAELKDENLRLMKRLLRIENGDKH